MISSPKTESIYFSLKSTALLSIYSPKKGKGTAMEIAKEAIEKNSISSFLKDASNKLETSVTDCEIKFVGSAPLISKLTEILKGMNLDLQASVERSLLQNIEVFFSPDTGKLQVSKEEAIQIRMEPQKCRVMIVDDSSTIRRLLTSIFSRDPLIEVVAAIENPLLVEEAIKKFKPDVLTLDIHMPQMDGVTLLKKISPRYNLPVVMITSITKEEGPLVLDALEHGAVDYVHKPSLDELDEAAPMMIEKVKSAAKAKIFTKQESQGLVHILSENVNHELVIAIGSSTGGTEALKDILVRLPAHIPPIVIVQHIPPVFSLALAKRLNELCSIEVKEAEDGDILQSGTAYIAKGGIHMKLKKHGATHRIVFDPSAKFNLHKPSVDILFNSVASVVGDKAIGIILTGMGKDGAKGLVEMKNKGAKTIAQNEETCVVFGMPREAIRLNAADRICGLSDIPLVLSQWVQKKKSKS